MCERAVKMRMLRILDETGMQLSIRYNRYGFIAKRTRETAVISGTDSLERRGAAGRRPTTLHYTPYPRGGTGSRTVMYK